MDWKGRLAGVSALGMLAVNSQACLLLSVIARPQVALLAKSNMVVWEPGTKTEQLVLSLALLSKSEEFDIVIPTPNKPQVAIVGQKPFSAMYNLINPPKNLEVFDLPMDDSGAEKEVALNDRFVKDLTTQTIQASDVVALSKWMEQKKYKPSDAAKDWLQRYIDRRWYLTALHVKSSYDMFKTDAVRFTFKTDMPFCPNYTSGPTWLNSVRQELYVVAPEQLKPMVGKSPWKGKAMNHSFLNDQWTMTLAKHLRVPTDQIPKHSWVNWAVEVGGTQNASDDLYFVPDKPVKQISKPSRP